MADLPAPVVTRHAEIGRALAASIPTQASVSASSALYPHLSQRAGAYLFPTVHDADYVLVDVSGTAYPGEPGGNRARLRGLLADGTYRLLAAEDGFVLLARTANGDSPRPDSATPIEPQMPASFLDFARAGTESSGPPIAAFDDGGIELVSARLIPSSEVGPRGPLGTLETVWRVRRPVPERPRPSVTVRFRDGTQQVFDNQPILWWYPPERWQPGELVRFTIPGLTVRDVVGWEASAPPDPPTP